MGMGGKVGGYEGDHHTHRKEPPAPDAERTAGGGSRAGIWGGTMPACDLWAERVWRMGSWGQERIPVTHRVVALGGVGWVYWQKLEEIRDSGRALPRSQGRDDAPLRGLA